MRQQQGSLQVNKGSRPKSHQPRHGLFNMSNILKKFRAVFWIILAFAGGAVATTVIGNWGMAILTWLWGHISASLKADYWPWAITFVSICVTILIWWMNRYLNVAFQTSTNLLEMDDSLLRLLGTWDRSLPYD